MTPATIDRINRVVVTDSLFDLLVVAHTSLMRTPEHDGYAHCKCELARLLMDLHGEHSEYAPRRRKARAIAKRKATMAAKRDRANNAPSQPDSGA